MIHWELAPALVSATMILLLPGLAVAWAGGARGWLLAGAAGPISVSIVGVTPIILQVFSLPWNIMAVLTVAIILAVAAAVVKFCFPSSHVSSANGLSNDERTINWPKPVSVLALAVPFTLILWRFGQIIGEPNNISQTFDNIFHLNALRYIEDTGNASSLLVGGFTSSTGHAGFYPAAWHDVVSLVMQLSGATIPESVNAVNMIIAAVLWPLSCMFLVVVLFGARPVILLASGVLMTGFASFPYLMVDFGVLYPNFLSIAVLPAAIALVAVVFRLGDEAQMHRTLGIYLFIGMLPGLALAHPSTLLTLMPWTFPAVAAAAHRSVRNQNMHMRSGVLLWLPVIAIAGYTALMLVLWKFLRPEEAMSTWEPIQGLSQAVGQALTSAPISGPVPWAIFFLSILGLHALAREPKLRWFLGVYIISCFVFIVVSGYPFGDLRTFVGGVWYNDPYRPAALLPVAALPVATFGAVWLWDLAGNSVRLKYLVMLTEGRICRLRSILAGVACLALVIVLVGLVQRGAVEHAVARASENYRYHDNSALLSLYERELLERVPRQVGPENTVIANPWTGASLVYALADRKTLTAHIFGRYDARTLTVLQHLHELDTNPEVCRAVEALNSYYLLDFGDQGVHGPIQVAPGTSGLEDNPNFELVDSQGPAKLYRINKCASR